MGSAFIGMEKVQVYFDSSVIKDLGRLIGKIWKKIIYLD